MTGASPETPTGPSTDSWVTGEAVGTLPDDRVPPEVQLRLLSRSRRQIVRTGRLTARVSVSETAALRFSVLARPRTTRRQGGSSRGAIRVSPFSELEVRGSSTRSATLTLTQAGRDMLRRGAATSLVVQVIARDTAGNVARRRIVVRLRA